MSRQNAEEAKSTQPASKRKTGNPSCSGHHLLTVPTKSTAHWKADPSIMKQEGWRRAKSSGTSGESYPLKTRSEQRGFLQPQFSQRCLCFSSTFQNFRNAVDMPLFFTLMQVKNCTGSNAITPTRLPAGSKMGLCWVTATWSLTAKPKQEKTQITVSNGVVFLMPHKRIVHSHLNSVVFLKKVHIGWGVGKEKRWAKPNWATASFSLPQPQVVKLFAPFP